MDSRLEQLEEQGKTMADATRRLLETVNAVKDTGELLLQMIDNSPPTPHPSEDWDAEADDMPFYIPVRRTITVEQWGVRCPACGGRPSRCPCS